MKNLFLNLIFLSILLPFFAFAQTTYRPSDFLYNIGSVKEVVQGPATTDGQRQTTTIYESGARMDIIPNSPNPPLIKWTLPDGSRYQTQPGSTDIYVQLTPPNIQSPATNTQPTTRLPELGQENILNSIVPPSTFDNGQSRGLSGILNQLFYAGLIIAVVLAIVMIIRGGIEYMTIDAASNKESAKNRIKAAIGGLVLCFSTILILNTINPGLTKLELRFPKLENLEQVELEGEVELAIVSRAREMIEESIVGPPTPGVPGVSTNGPIPTTYFGGPTDVRTKDGYALHYCNSLMQYAKVGEQADTTNVGGTIYRWCWALDANGNKISYPQGMASAHGGYFEPTSFSTGPNDLMRNLTGDYIAYPLNNSAASTLTGLPSVSSNSQLRGKNVVLTLVNGSQVVARIGDRGPHGSRAKLDVSPSLSRKIQQGGGLKSVVMQ
jgi:hypothetical protein